MSERHPDDARLNDWAEGLLPPPETQAIDAHIAACDDCRSRAEGLRRLLGDLAGLPRTADPGADLRPEIRRALARRARRRSLRAARVPLSVAAAILVVGTAAVTALIVRSLDDDGAAASGASTAVVATDRDAAHVTDAADALAELRALERDYTRAAEDLLAALAGARGELPPGTARLVEQNVAIVERALVESRAALEEDPASLVLRDLVLAAHRQRLDVLRRATALAAGT